MAYNNVKVKERQTVSQSSQKQQLGIVSEVPMNEWNAEISYEKLNIVTYKNGTFIAKRANVGIAPLDTDGWRDVWMPLLSGVGISSTVVEYASGSTSSPTPPQDGWGADIPAFQVGQLLWTRLTITYTNGISTVFYSVGVTLAPSKTSELINDGNDGTSPFATEAFTNSSINNLAAFYITYNADDNAFPTKAALTGATTFYNDKKPRIPTTNDYAIVLADESQPKGIDGTYPTTRYIYQGGTYPAGSWSFQWVINNTTFTQAQVDALNSGITASAVEQITTNKNDIATLKVKEGTQDNAIEAVKRTADNAIPSNLKGAANGVATLDKNGKIYNAQLPDSLQFISQSDKGVPNGVASLDGNGRVPASQLLNAFPVGKIIVGIDTASPASYLGGSWTKIDSGLALWTTSSSGGSKINAGLPNITGDVPCLRADLTNLQGAFAEGTAGNHLSQGGAGSTSAHFDASRVNSIYGNSATVQPPAYTVVAWRRTA